MENKFENRKPSKTFDLRFTPLNELPKNKCDLTFETVRQLAIAIYKNDLSYLKDQFERFSSKEKEQFFSLFIIYNQLGDDFLKKSDCAELIKSTRSGFPLHLAEQLMAKKSEYQDMHDMFKEEIKLLGFTTTLGKSTVWSPSYFISPCALVKKTLEMKKEEGYELRLF